MEYVQNVEQNKKEIVQGLKNVKAQLLAEIENFKGCMENYNSVKAEVEKLVDGKTTKDLDDVAK